MQADRGPSNCRGRTRDAEEADHAAFKILLAVAVVVAFLLILAQDQETLQIRSAPPPRIRSTRTTWPRWSAPT